MNFLSSIKLPGQGGNIMEQLNQYEQRVVHVISLRCYYTIAMEGRDRRYVAAFQSSFPSKAVCMFVLLAYHTE